MKPKHTYEFRIIAENKYGQSKPCEPTAPIAIPEQRIRKKGYDGKEFCFGCIGCKFVWKFDLFKNLNDKILIEVYLFKIFYS